MPTLKPPTNYIAFDDSGRAILAGTTIKIIELALNHLANGWSAEEMHYQHPHLSLAQVYAALAYYYDHQPEFDRQIEESRRRAETLAAETNDSPIRRRLRAAGKL